MRSFGEGKYQSVDDYPFGGHPGMLLKYKVVEKALSCVPAEKVIYLTPRGKQLNQKMVNEYSSLNSLTILCGHYEGVDERIIKQYVDDEVSLGDYILSGGESASLVLIEAIARKIPCFMGNKVSGDDESFENDLLEYDQYTRPETCNDLDVPPVLLSGHHKKIESWKRANSLINTWKRRPELLKKVKLSNEDRENLATYINNLSVKAYRSK